MNPTDLRERLDAAKHTARWTYLEAIIGLHRQLSDKAVHRRYLRAKDTERRIADLRDPALDDDYDWHADLAAALYWLLTNRGVKVCTRCDAINAQPHATTCPDSLTTLTRKAPR